MKKMIISILALILIISSCSGLLWNGDSSDQLKISINNPFYQGGSSSSSRALALQGKYLYIELARIDNQSSYDAWESSSAFTLTGDGVWEETEWGGHAVLTFDIVNIDQMIAIFKEIPRDQDLQARVFLDLSKSALENTYELYGSDGDPICMTYNASGQNFVEKSWVTVNRAALNDNSIILPIRPPYLDQPNWLTALNLSDEYHYGPFNTKPSVGETSFTELNPDISSLNIRDLGYFSNISGEVVGTVDTSLRSVSTLHDTDGNTFPNSAPVLTLVADAGGSGLPGYLYRSLQVQAVTRPDYTNPGFFMSSTLYTDPVTGDSDDSWEVSYGILYDSTASAISGTVSWSLPSGLQIGDLEFSVLHIADLGVPDTDLDTINKIYNSGLNIDVDTEWNQTLLSSSTYTNALFNTTNGSWAIVLARIAGSSPFIFARYNLGP